MFYANMNLKKQEVEMNWGLLYRYEAGEEGRGRRLLCLPTSPNAIDIEAGLHKDLTIGFTKTGRPRVNKVENNLRTSKAAPPQSTLAPPFQCCRAAVPHTA